jgi:hypothetical protein
LIQIQIKTPSVQALGSSKREQFCWAFGQPLRYSDELLSVH